MENEGATADAKMVTVMVIHPNFKTVTVTVFLGKLILKSNKTAGNNFDSKPSTSTLLTSTLVFRSGGGSPFGGSNSSGL